MNITRRGLLQGILAAGIAPAVVSSQNISRIFVPKHTLLFPRGLGLSPDFIHNWHDDEFSTSKIMTKKHLQRFGKKAICFVETMGLQRGDVRYELVNGVFVLDPQMSA